MKKTLILVGFLALAPFAKGQLLLEALEGGIPFTPSEKCLERVYDKHYGDGVHNYIYCAVQGPNGKKWLNLNLGAEYAKESSPHFNPEATPTDYNDWKAFGNLYQWGRDSDGHEQVEYNLAELENHWFIRPINGVRSTILKAGEQSNQMVADPYFNTYAQDLGPTWDKDPCPIGYHIASADDIFALGRITNISGGMTTPSVLWSASYPYVKLVTSPGVTQKLIVNGFQKSEAKMEDFSNDIGTSAFWLSGVPKGLMRLWLGEDWRFVVGYNADVYRMTWLDRGFYLPNTTPSALGITSVPHVTYAPVQGFDWGGSQAALAIRCVQN